MKTARMWFALTIITVALGAMALGAGPALGADPVKIGLVAALSGGSAASGEAITRGLTVAIEEINANGGLLGGRTLELVRRDDEANPTKAVTAGRGLTLKEQEAALFGGTASPRAFAIAPTANAG